jgi:hypothetical protein
MPAGGSADIAIAVQDDKGVAVFERAPRAGDHASSGDVKRGFREPIKTFHRL